MIRVAASDTNGGDGVRGDVLGGEGRQQEADAAAVVRRAVGSVEEDALGVGLEVEDVVANGDRVGGEVEALHGALHVTYEGGLRRRLRL